MKSGIRVLLTLVMLITGFGPLFAFSFRPITMQFAPAGPESGKTFQVLNTTNRPIAVRISMTTRALDVDGSETLRDASEFFTVFPERLVLQPEQRQAVRVQWRGPSELDQERAFRIIAEQIPVRFDSDQSDGGSINIMFRYRGSVYVTPPGATHRLEVEDVQRVTEEDGNVTAHVVVRNNGTAHVIMQDLEVKITYGSDEILLRSDQLAGMNGENMLAGASRRFVIDIPDHVPNIDLDADLRFQPVR